jgi:glutamate-1-semialdehyde 2,1-aminomutase
MNTDRSRALFEETKRLIPGGVNSPVRAFGAVGGTPLFYRSASGATFTDEDDNLFIDFCCSWGPLILGHAHPAVLEAVRRAAADGLSFGAPSHYETELARLVVDTVEPVERVRFVNSGTEAVMSAVRLARGFTGRALIVKFEGCYHGHADHLLVKGGSGLATFGTPSSAGVPDDVVRNTVTLPLDNEAAAEALFNERGDEIAVVVVEPAPANAGLLIQSQEFLQRLRDLTRSAGALLLFDEVISGFRVGPGGAAGLYGITPDLMTFGKIIGSGMPVGAFGGRRDVMETIAPLGPVYQAGTLSGNPVAMAAGAAGLGEILKPGFYEDLESKAVELETRVVDTLTRLDAPVSFVRMGSIFWFAFQPPPPPSAFHMIDGTGMERYALFHRALLERGVYLAPSGYEVGFLSSAHSIAHIETAVKAIEEALIIAHPHLA